MALTVAAATPSVADSFPNTVPRLRMAHRPNRLPAATKQAMLLMIADWDANRLPVKVESEAVTNQLLKNKVYYQP